MESLTKTIALNSIFALLGRLLVKIFSFAFTIFIARSLGEADFGTYTLIWSYVAVFATASDFGLGMYLIRELAKDTANQSELTCNVIAFRLVAAGATLALIGLSLLWTGYSLTTVGHILLAGTILFFYALQDPLDSVLQAHERIDLSSSLKIAGQLIFIVLGFFFLSWGWSITGLILASLGNLLITTILAWLLIQKYGGRLQWQVQPRLWPKLLSAAGAFGLIGFALNWLQKFDTVILSLYWPYEVIGWYNAAYNLVLAVLIISNALNIAFYPTLTREHNHNHLALPMIYQRLCKYLFSISLPVGTGLFILSRPIIIFLYGNSYAPAAIPLLILAGVIPLGFISEFLRYIQLVIGREGYAAVALILASLGNIGLNLLLIPRFGMIAAAVATVLSETILVGLYLWQLRHLITLKVVAAAFWKPALASLVMAGILLLTLPFNLALSVCLGSSAFAMMLLALKFFEAEEKLFIRKMFGRLFVIGLS